MGGFLGAIGGGVVFGGFTGAGAGALSSVTDVSRFGCFPAGTRVLMADGTARPIEEVEAGDRVASADPDTGRPATATVTATFTHRDMVDSRPQRMHLGRCGRRVDRHRNR